MKLVFSRRVLVGKPRRGETKDSSVRGIKKATAALSPEATAPVSRTLIRKNKHRPRKLGLQRPLPIVAAEDPILPNQQVGILHLSLIHI